MIIKKDPATIRSYFEDSSNLSGGYADAVYIVETIDELASVMQRANQAHTPVTVCGGGTGTTGGKIPFGGIVVSLERFNRIVSLAGETRRAVVQSGVMVEDFTSACDRAGLFYPCHPTETTASIGGTVATNASGARSLKYGPTRRYVDALTMVMPTGQIWHLERGKQILRRGQTTVTLPGGQTVTVPLPSYTMPAVKNAAGYYACDGMDIIDLFIGQEGTLSIITDVTLRVVEKPRHLMSAIVFFPAEEDAWQFAAAAGIAAQQGAISGLLSLEYFDAHSLALLRPTYATIPPSVRAAIFIEQELDRPADAPVLDYWLALIAQHHASSETTWVAMNERDAGSFTAFRHALPEAVNTVIRRRGFAKVSTDMAVPATAFPEMLAFYKDSLAREGIDHLVFGHIGECHLHVNLLPNTADEYERSRALYRRFAKRVIALGGTVSAEHGIGKIKHDYLQMMYGRAGILEMARIKKAFDPHAILGRDTMFSKEVLSLV